jgi:hypothetical protein
MTARELIVLLLKHDNLDDEVFTNGEVGKVTDVEVNRQQDRPTSPARTWLVLTVD